MLRAPHSPARVSLPLNTAILIVPRAYYIRFPPEWQAETGMGLVFALIFQGGVGYFNSTPLFMFPADRWGGFTAPPWAGLLEKF